MTRSHSRWIACGLASEEKSVHPCHIWPSACTWISAFQAGLVLNTASSSLTYATVTTVILPLIANFHRKRMLHSVRKTKRQSCMSDHLRKPKQKSWSGTKILYINFKTRRVGLNSPLQSVSCYLHVSPSICLRVSATGCRNNSLYVR